VAHAHRFITGHVGIDRVLEALEARSKEGNRYRCRSCNLGNDGGIDFRYTSLPPENMTEQELITVAVKAVEIYAARHPRPAYVTLGQAAEMMGRVRQTAKRVLDFHKVRTNAVGYYPTEEIDKVLAMREV
jgi:hypothetical protein